MRKPSPVEKGQEKSFVIQRKVRGERQENAEPGTRYADVSKEKTIPSGSVNDTAYLHSFLLNHIEDEVVVNDEHSIFEPLEPFVFRNNAHEGLRGKLLDFGIEPIQQRCCGGGVVPLDVFKDFRKVLFSSTKVSNLVWPGHSILALNRLTNSR